ncbi:hypothetical protein F4780DRAFT_781641 [Xylariomycetidae sp. FL0641]|nr:hypothetical protein F4780DRAFT_781641 [Xylariomycetidae sp. FL0641]
MVMGGDLTFPPALPQKQQEDHKETKQVKSKETQQGKSSETQQVKSSEAQQVKSKETQQGGSSVAQASSSSSAPLASQPKLETTASRMAARQPGPMVTAPVSSDLQELFRQRQVLLHETEAQLAGMCTTPGPQTQQPSAQRAHSPDPDLQSQFQELEIQSQSGPPGNMESLEQNVRDLAYLLTAWMDPNTILTQDYVVTTIAGMIGPMPQVGTNQYGEWQFKRYHIFRQFVRFMSHYVMTYHSQALKLVELVRYLQLEGAIDPELVTQIMQDCYAADQVQLIAANRVYGMADWFQREGFMYHVPEHPGFFDMIASQHIWNNVLQIQQRVQIPDANQLGQMSGAEIRSLLIDTMLAVNESISPLSQMILTRLHPGFIEAQGLNLPVLPNAQDVLPGNPLFQHLGNQDVENDDEDQGGEE